jgi:hypothetical protein
VAACSRAVTPGQIDQRFREMEREGAHPASVNKLRALLHLVFHRACPARLGYVSPRDIARDRNARRTEFLAAAQQEAHRAS